MFKLDSLYEAAKDRHSELLNTAAEARRTRSPRVPAPESSLSKWVTATAALMVAAAVTALRVAAAAGGGGGAGPRLMF
jgi:hypothetical protein